MTIPSAIILLCCLLQVCVAQLNTPSVKIDYCTTGSCGNEGRCEDRRTGARCVCSNGWMGVNCKRPCQNVYNSCERWHEKRSACDWVRRISPWFDDNCPVTCNKCQHQTGLELVTPLPIILEPLAWLIGRWETESTNENRFPLPITGGYREVVDFRIADAPMFDRPPLNYSARAVSLADSADWHIDLGFVTGKPFLEDTGFAQPADTPDHGDDLVALELNSNTGINTIEEGVLTAGQITLNVTFIRPFPGTEHFVFAQSLRSYKLLENGHLEEAGEMLLNDGSVKTWRKLFTKTFDYLIPRPPDGNDVEDVE